MCKQCTQINEVTETVASKISMPKCTHFTSSNQKNSANVHLPGIVWTLDRTPVRGFFNLMYPAASMDTHMYVPHTDKPRKCPRKEKMNIFQEILTKGCSPLLLSLLLEQDHRVACAPKKHRIQGRLLCCRDRRHVEFLGGNTTSALGCEKAVS
jgi:hypothetical protein